MRTSVSKKTLVAAIPALAQLFQILASPTPKKPQQILSELTGEDIWAKLQKMDLHEVLRTLEQAGALAQP
jgi:hypothetical protein